MSETATKDPGTLRQEAEETKNRIRRVELERAELLREAIEAGRSGASPNGARAKLLEADAELDILKGTLEAIEEELPEAERAAAAVKVAEIADEAKALGDEAKAVAEEAAAALRELVTKARRLEEMDTSYRNAVSQARNIAKAKGVAEPRMGNDIHTVAWPASPDRWGVGYWWGSKVVPVLSDFGHVITALDGADHWKEREES